MGRGRREEKVLLKKILSITYILFTVVNNIKNVRDYGRMTNNRSAIEL